MTAIVLSLVWCGGWLATCGILWLLGELDEDTAIWLLLRWPAVMVGLPIAAVVLLIWKYGKK